MHRIRLRHPWKSETRDGCVCWSRSFNWPADNATGDDIFLAIRPWPTEARVELNGKPLAAVDSSPRSLVTSLLRESSLLQISLPLDGGQEGQFPLEVQLEIEESSGGK